MFPTLRIEGLPRPGCSDKLEIWSDNMASCSSLHFFLEQNTLRTSDSVHRRLEAQNSADGASPGPR
jgi:hypothetical protein